MHKDSNHDRGRSNLGEQAGSWATPQARDYRTPDLEGSGNYKRKGAAGYTIDRNSQAGNWATPAALDWNIDSPDGSPNHSPPLGRQALRANGAKCHNGNGLLWQTPRSSAKGPPGSSARHGGQPKGMRLNPCFVEWLMGLPPFWTLPSSTELTASDASGTL